MSEWMEKYNDAERQLDHYRIQASKISRLVPQKIRELEEQVANAEHRYKVEKKNTLVLEQQMSDDIGHQRVLEIQNETLQSQVVILKHEISEKDDKILSLLDEIEELKSLRKKDEESVRHKVQLIKEHIQKSIQSLKVENQVLKRQVEQVESIQIKQLNTEIERLKEINRIQGRDRMAIFEEGYKKCKRDFQIQGKSPKLDNNPTFSPIYQQTSSASSQDPLYSSISPDDRATHCSPMKYSFNAERVSPPLPPRRTSVSKHTVEERRRKLPSSSQNITCCPPAGCCTSKSQYEPLGQPQDTPSPPPLSQREEADGSVSNDYDEIPGETGINNGFHSFDGTHVRLRSVSSTSSSPSKTQRIGMYTSPSMPAKSPFTSTSMPPKSPFTSPRLNNLNSPAYSCPFKSNGQMNGYHQQRDPMSPTKQNSAPKQPKRSWEMLVDSLALVGFTDALPKQRCVKSSIGKLPTYSVTEQVSYTDHPYEVPPMEGDEETPIQYPEPVTDMERIIDKLQCLSEGQVKQLISSPLLSYTSQPLSAPLTNLKTPYLTMCALRVNKLLLDFAETPKDLYTTSRTLLTLTNHELVNEVYTQLLKQTHRQPTEMLAYWQLLAILIPFNIPNGRTMKFLKNHLDRYKTQKTAAGRFAGYCTKMLLRRLAFGKRQVHPCRMEIEATKGRPYVHSKPMSIPIHLPGGDYHVTGFDTVSSVSEVIRDLESQLNLRTCRWSGFTLMMDDPINPDVKVPVNHSSKICDVIAKWEANVKPNNNQIPQIIGLTYMKYLQLNTNNDMITALETKLSALQIHSESMEGYHGMGTELATCMGALMAQAVEGNCPVKLDHKKSVEYSRVLTEHFSRYIPIDVRESCTDPVTFKQLLHKFAEVWDIFRDLPTDLLYEKYFRTAQKWKYSRSTLFRGLYLQDRDGLKIAICLNVTENRLTIINAETLVIMDAVDMDKITKFGGSPFSITLRINNTQLSLMLVDKHKCYLLTELLASYCRLTHLVDRDD